MSKVCEVCGKKQLSVNKICFSHKAHKTTQQPNLQSIKTLVNGSPKRVKACTSCIKAGKVQKVY